eukprot:1228040-Amphidinium_carterae.1
MKPAAMSLTEEHLRARNAVKLININLSLRRIRHKPTTLQGWGVATSGTGRGWGIKIGKHFGFPNNMIPVSIASSRLGNTDLTALEIS